MPVHQLILQGCLALCQIQDAPSPAELSRQILDDSRPAEERQKLAADHADQAGAIVAAMVADLPAENLDEEYRRIPWIWRVSIAAGKSNRDGPLRSLVEVALPKEGERLRDWQAVVIGGGIINGLSQNGDWPQPRIEKLLSDDKALQRRWHEALAAAAVMADDPKTKAGTRYDALRMIALNPTDERIKQLAKYLSDTNAELQMGAVSGLSDVDDPQAIEHLSAALPNLPNANQSLAIDALLRTEARIDAILALLRSGKLSAAALSQRQRQKLRELANPDQRNRALRLLENEG